MKFISMALVTVLGFSVGRMNCVAGPLPADRIYRETNPRVVTIYTEDSEGEHGYASGFFYQSGHTTCLVTAYHAVAGKRLLVIGVESGRLYEGAVLKYSKELDLAILKADPVEPALKGSRKTTRVGDVCYTIGSPRGLFGTLGSGIVSAYRVDDAGRLLIQFTAPVSPGSSGCPLLDDRGRVIGVVVQLIPGQALNFALPIEYIDLALE